MAGEQEEDSTQLELYRVTAIHNHTLALNEQLTERILKLETQIQELARENTGLRIDALEKLKHYSRKADSTRRSRARKAAHEARLAREAAAKAASEPSEPK